MVITGSAFSSPPFDGVIHSVFPSALNIRVKEPWLLTLLADESLCHPASALVCNRDGSRPDFTRLGLTRGAAVRFEADRALFAGGLAMHVAGSVRREPVEKSAPEGFDWKTRLLSACSRELEHRQMAAGTLLRWSDLGAGDIQNRRGVSCFTSRFRAAAYETAHALDLEEAGLAVDASLRLVGLGPGLTPTGDDFLCGFALAAWLRAGCRADAPGRLSPVVVREWLDGLLQAADGPIKLTSDVSISFLQLARRRMFSNALMNLAYSFVPRKHETFDEALDILGHMGHSSGYDGATGLIFGLYRGCYATRVQIRRSKEQRGAA